MKNHPNVAAYGISKDVRIYRLKAEVTWYVGSFPEGHSRTGFVECEHLHETRAAADECKARLEREVERHPERFPHLAEALRDLEQAQEAQLNTEFDRIVDHLTA